MYTYIHVHEKPLHFYIIFISFQSEGGALARMPLGPLPFQFGINNGQIHCIIRKKGKKLSIIYDTYGEKKIVSKMTIQSQYSKIISYSKRVFTFCFEHFLTHMIIPSM